jgi:outer membrane lipoprotein SlyB
MYAKDCDDSHIISNDGTDNCRYLSIHLGLATMNLRYLVLVFTLMVVEANADSSTLDAAIGGGIGGAAGAAIGNEVGGRNGAIIGGALGGAVGVAVNTDDEPRHTSTHRETYYRIAPQQEHHESHFCPPGQAKKGRC